MCMGIPKHSVPSPDYIDPTISGVDKMLVGSSFSKQGTVCDVLNEMLIQFSGYLQALPVCVTE